MELIKHETNLYESEISGAMYYSMQKGDEMSYCSFVQYFAINCNAVHTSTQRSILYDNLIADISYILQFILRSEEG